VVPVTTYYEELGKDDPRRFSHHLSDCEYSFESNEDNPVLLWGRVRMAFKEDLKGKYNLDEVSDGQYLDRDLNLNQKDFERIIIHTTVGPHHCNVIVLRNARSKQVFQELVEKLGAKPKPHLQ
jgi:hypothetical protein